MSKYLILVRHADSEKNRTGRFSSDSVGDKLTHAGSIEVAQLVNSLRSVFDHWSIRDVSLCSASSGRAVSTAEAIADSFQLPMRTFPGLASIYSGSLAGQTEDWAREKKSNYMEWLDLYRSGLASSYEIPRPDGGESLPDFEARIESSVAEILSMNGDTKIIVAHRSPITAILISYARQFLGYPRDFFGYVPLKTAGVSLINLSERRVEFVNRSAGETDFEG